MIIRQFLLLRFFTAIIILLAFFFVSCTPTKQVIYFNDYADSSASSIKTAKAAFENSIQKNDQLWITVGGSNLADLPALNSGNGIGATGGSTALAGGNSALGYLVEADGNIQIPYAGKVKAEGMTRMQLETKLTDLLKDYTKNPIVNVRFLNYSFSVLGEVTRSGRYNMPTERITILDALSMAGDITEMGRRDNIVVIREENGERKVSKLNLLKKDIFNSPFFYLKTNDVVYVEPVKARFFSRTGIPQYVSIVAIGVSLLITVINIRRN
ncbi:MAG: polysaccharide biosynthesis/export family protein [Chitinophagaceae bacterium]|nr:polysaccharide biosynthesis/export family protein [Chitinophagaceae bacterium]